MILLAPLNTCRKFVRYGYQINYKLTPRYCGMYLWYQLHYYGIYLHEFKLLLRINYLNCFLLKYEKKNIDLCN